MNLESVLPLQGKKVIITRAQNQQTEARDLFEAKGARVFDLPSLVIVPPDDFSPLDEALLKLKDFHWIIFSSANGVKAVEQRLQLLGSSLHLMPKSLKIASVGKKTSTLLESFNVIPNFVPPEFVADSLIHNFPTSAMGLKILIPRVQTGGRTILAEAFGQAGAQVIEVPAYESKCPADIPKETFNELNNSKVDAIVFTSGKTVANTSRLIYKFFGDRDILKGVKIISIGPQTSISCQKYFNRFDEEANRHDLDGLVQACIQSIGKSN